MKKFISTFFLCLLLSSVSDAASDNDSHFCVPVDLEKLEHYRQSRPAASKQALDAGQPRTVRMIYFVSDPQGFRQEVVDKMKTTIREVQRIYADQISAHGFGERTFNYEKDPQGEPMIHIVYGSGGNYDYVRALGRIEREYGYDLESNIYFIVLGNEEDIQLQNVLGLGLQTSRNGGWAMLRQYIDPNFVARAAHELGHAFGLWHNFNSDAYIMSYGPGQGTLSEFSAGHLAVHPHFNSDSSMYQEYVLDLPTCEILSSHSYRTGATSVPIQLELSDPDGLQQVSLFVTTPETHFSAGSPELKTGRLLGGATNAVVDLQYDGIIPSDPGATNFSTILTHKMTLETVDMLGNIRKIGLSLLHDSTHKLIIPLDRQKGPRGHGANGVAFSPDGKILAAGTENLTVELWNAETGAHIATLEGYNPYRGYIKQVFSLAFSPDGKILATGTWHGSIKLWDIATRTEITTFTLTAYQSRIMSLAFSPDGKILAAGITDAEGSGPNIIRLWDMETKTQLPPLIGHTHGVQSVAFSPDGKTLASGAFDSTIRLWDVATKTQIAKLPYETQVNSVSFSPDGKTLVSSAFNNKVAFWDVDKKAFKDQFYVRVNNLLRYASFTLDGEKIVTASQGGDIDLRDANTYEKIARFQGNTNARLHGACTAFSPDGTTFATSLGGGYEREGDYTIVLWDMSPYVTPVVHIADFNLKAAIRETLGKSGYGPITRTDIARLTTLNVSNRNIRDLIGLEFATNLTTLNLTGNPLSSAAINTYIPDLKKRGVEVLFDKPSLPADFDGSGTVDVADFLAFVDQFGLSRGDAGYDARYDLDGNGEIGIGDFLIFVNAFGKTASS